MLDEEVNRTESKNISLAKGNKSKKSHNNHSFTNTNEEFASEIGVEDDSSERNPISERSAWH